MWLKNGCAPFAPPCGRRSPSPRPPHALFRCPSSYQDHAPWLKRTPLASGLYGDGGGAALQHGVDTAFTRAVVGNTPLEAGNAEVGTAPTGAAEALVAWLDAWRPHPLARGRLGLQRAEHAMVGALVHHAGCAAEVEQGCRTWARAEGAKGPRPGATARQVTQALGDGRTRLHRTIQSIRAAQGEGDSEEALTARVVARASFLLRVYPAVGTGQTPPEARLRRDALETCLLLLVAPPEVDVEELEECMKARAQRATTRVEGFNLLLRAMGAAASPSLVLSLVGPLRRALRGQTQAALAPVAPSAPAEASDGSAGTADSAPPAPPTLQRQRSSDEGAVTHAAAALEVRHHYWKALEGAGAALLQRVRDVFSELLRALVVRLRLALRQMDVRAFSLLCWTVDLDYGPHDFGLLHDLGLQDLLLAACAPDTADGQLSTEPSGQGTGSEPATRAWQLWPAQHVHQGLRRGFLRPDQVIAHLRSAPEEVLPASSRRSLGLDGGSSPQSREDVLGLFLAASRLIFAARAGGTAKAEGAVVSIQRMARGMLTRRLVGLHRANSGELVLSESAPLAVARALAQGGAKAAAPDAGEPLSSPRSVAEAADELAQGAGRSHRRGSEALDLVAPPSSALSLEARASEDVEGEEGEAQLAHAEAATARATARTLAALAGGTKYAASRAILDVAWTLTQRLALRAARASAVAPRPILPSTLQPSLHWGATMLRHSVQALLRDVELLVPLIETAADARAQGGSPGSPPRSGRSTQLVEARAHRVLLALSMLGTQEAAARELGDRRALRVLVSLAIRGSQRLTRASLFALRCVARHAGPADLDAAVSEVQGGGDTPAAEGGGGVCGPFLRWCWAVLGRGVGCSGAQGASSDLPHALGVRGWGVGTECVGRAANVLAFLRTVLTLEPWRNAVAAAAAESLTRWGSIGAPGEASTRAVRDIAATFALMGGFGDTLRTGAHVTLPGPAGPGADAASAPRAAAPDAHASTHLFPARLRSLLSPQPEAVVVRYCEGDSHALVRFRSGQATQLIRASTLRAVDEVPAWPGMLGDADALVTGTLHAAGALFTTAPAPGVLAAAARPEALTPEGRGTGDPPSPADLSLSCALTAAVRTAPMLLLHGPTAQRWTEDATLPAGKRAWGGDEGLLPALVAFAATPAPLPWLPTVDDVLRRASISLLRHGDAAHGECLLWALPQWPHYAPGGEEAGAGAAGQSTALVVTDSAPTTASAAAAPRSDMEPQVSQLVELGIERDLALAALDMCGGDVEEAVDAIFTHRHEVEARMWTNATEGRPPSAQPPAGSVSSSAGSIPYLTRVDEPTSRAREAKSMAQAVGQPPLLCYFALMHKGEDVNAASNWLLDEGQRYVRTAEQEEAAAKAEVAALREGGALDRVGADASGELDDRAFLRELEEEIDYTVDSTTNGEVAGDSDGDTDGGAGSGAAPQPASLVGAGNVDPVSQSRINGLRGQIRDLEIVSRNYPPERRARTQGLIRSLRDRILQLQGGEPETPERGPGATAAPGVRVACDLAAAGSGNDDESAVWRTEDTPPQREPCSLLWRYGLVCGAAGEHAAERDRRPASSGPPSQPPPLSRDASTSSDAFGHGSDTPWRTPRAEGRGLTSPSSLRLSTLTRQQSHGESEARQAGQRARTAGRLRAEVELEPVQSVAELMPGSAVTLTQAHGALRRLHGLTGTVVRPGREQDAVVVRLEDPETGASILHTLALPHLRRHGRLLGVRVEHMGDLRSIAVHAHTTAAIVLARLIPAALLAVNPAGGRAASSPHTRAMGRVATTGDAAAAAETPRLVSAFRGIALPLARASAGAAADGGQAGPTEPLNDLFVAFYSDLLNRELRRPTRPQKRSRQAPSLHTSRGLAAAADQWREAVAGAGLHGGKEDAAGAVSSGWPLREGLVLECAAHLLGGASPMATVEVDTAVPVVVHETPHPLIASWSHRETVCVEAAASVVVVFSDRCHLPEGSRLLVYDGPRPMGEPVAICKGKGPWPSVLVQGNKVSYNFQCPTDLAETVWGWRMLLAGTRSRRKHSERDVASTPSLAWGQWLLRFLLDALDIDEDDHRRAAGAVAGAGAAPEAAKGGDSGESLALVVTLLIAYLRAPRAPGKAGAVECLAQLATRFRGRDAQAILKAVTALEAPVSKSLAYMLDREGVNTAPVISPARQAVKQALQARGVSSLAEVGTARDSGAQGAVSQVTTGPLADPRCAALPRGLFSAVRLVVACTRLRQAMGSKEGDHNASRRNFVTPLVDFLDIASHLCNATPLTDQIIHRVLNIVHDHSGDPRKGRRGSMVKEARRLLHEWDAALDSDLREWVERFARRHALPVLGLVAADVPLTEEDKLRNPDLAETNAKARALRLALLQLFNGRLARTMGLIPFDGVDAAGDAGSDPRVAVQRNAGAIFFDVKHAIVQAQLSRTKVASHLYRRPSVTLDNAQAFAAVDKGQRFASGRDALRSSCTFAQLFLALRGEEDKLWKMRLDERGRLFGVTYAHEEGLDWGGLYRDVVERACADLCSTHFDLFVPVPDAKAAGEQPCSDAYVPNPRHTSPPALQRFEFLGKLMGAAIRLQQYLPLHIAPLVWRALLGNALGEGDVEEIDSTFIAHIRDLREEFHAFVDEAASEMGREGPSDCSLEDLQAARRRRNEVLGVDPEQGEEGPDGTPLSFAVCNAGGEVVELLPQGAREAVTRERLSEYASLAMDNRLHEFDPAIKALRRGLTAVVPASALMPLTWRELELLVCGDDFVSVARLRSHATYQGWDASSEVVQRFWRVMESLSQEDLVGFVRLTWGRSRLPREDQWPEDMPFKLTKNNRGDEALPLAHACFFQMELPQYSSDDIMRRRLLAAINYGGGEFEIR